MTDRGGVRDRLEDFFRAALNAVDPAAAVGRSVWRTSGDLVVADEPIAPDVQLVVLAAGKASVAMANSLDAIDGCYVVNECRQICDLAIVHRSTVRIDVLAQQVNFAHALLGERSNLGNNIVEWATDFLTTRVRNHAEAAVLAATFHDGYERRRTVRAWFGKSIELLDLRK